MDISKFTPHTVYTIYIAATPEQVWQALTTAEFSRKYFSGFAVELQEKVGGAASWCARRTARNTSPAR